MERQGMQPGGGVSLLSKSDSVRNTHTHIRIHSHTCTNTSVYSINIKLSIKIKFALFLLPHPRGKSYERYGKCGRGRQGAEWGTLTWLHKESVSRQWERGGDGGEATELPKSLLGSQSNCGNCNERD